MGCGGSKYDDEGEAVPVKIRPHLRRRIEEIKQRRKACGLKEPTPSKKELLRNDTNEEESSSAPDSLHHDDEQNTVSLPESDKIKKEPVNKERHTTPAKKEEGKTEDKVEAVKIADSEDDEEEGLTEEEGEYEEEGRLSTAEGCYICPGSPSFRVYCVESIAIKDVDADKNDCASANGESQPCESGASGDSSELQGPTEIRKKGKRGRRFRRVMPKGRQAAVKNLLNVKSCYHRASASHDQTQLIQKTAA